MFAMVVSPSVRHKIMSALKLKTVQEIFMELRRNIYHHWSTYRVQDAQFVDIFLLSEGFVTVKLSFFVVVSSVGIKRVVSSSFCDKIVSAHALFKHRYM